MNGIRAWVGTMVCAVLSACIGSATFAHTYWAYYDCAPGLSTVIVLTNASGVTMEDAAAVRLYDANGSPILQSVYGLTAYESRAVYLNALFTETDESTWGLAEIESQLLLQIGSWLGTGEGWLFVENYGELGVIPSDLSIDAYWYGLNYANTQNRRTTVTILNPHDRLVFGSLYMYDAHGTLLYYRELPLPARRPTYLDLESVCPIGDDAWGLVDIKAEEQVLLVCGYFDADGYLIDVDVVDHPYYLEITEQE